MIVPCETAHRFEAATLGGASIADSIGTVSRMIVTGAFFCDAANVSDGKLNVLGGVFDLISVGSMANGMTYPVKVVALLQARPDDGPAPTITAEVFGPDGALLAGSTAPGRTSTTGGENRFVFADFQVPFRAEGRHVFMISAADGSPVAIPLTVRVRAAPR